MKKEFVNFYFHVTKIHEKTRFGHKSKQGFRRLLVSRWRQVWGGWLKRVRTLMISQPTPFNPMYYQSAYS